MLTSKDASIVYETLLISPGMNEIIKIPLALKRKALLMLVKLIEQTIDKDVVKEGLLSVLDEEITEELQKTTQALLERGGLEQLSERLNSLNLK